MPLETWDPTIYGFLDYMYLMANFLGVVAVLKIIFKHLQSCLQAILIGSK